MGAHLSGVIEGLNTRMDMRDIIAIVESAGRERVSLIEGMRLLSSDMALYIAPHGMTFILYRSPVGHTSALSLSKIARRSLKGYADVSRENDGRPYWSINAIYAERGYGPLMYAIVAESIRTHGGVLVPSDRRSSGSVKVWANFNKNPFVSVVRVDGGVGIVGNGSLDLAAAIQSDADVLNRLGEEWRDELLSEASSRLDDELDRVWGRR